MLRISLNYLNLISLMHDKSDFFLNLGKLEHLPEFHVSGQCETELQRMIENKNSNNTAKFGANHSRITKEKIRIDDST